MMNSKKTDVEKFERYAETHDMGGEVADFEQRSYRNYLENLSGKILDIGSGDGKYVQFFHAISPRSHVIPLDISTTRMKRIVAQGFSGAAGSATKLPFQNRVFDRVFLMQVIEHIENADLAASECARVLKSDGICFITTPNYPIKRIYDWLQVLRYGKGNRILDDPTHCSKFSADQLTKTLRKYFESVEVFPSFVLGEARFGWVRRWRDRRKSSMFFTHKLLAICKSPLTERASCEL